MQWTPNKVTALRVAVGFAAVSLFGRGPWANLAAVVLTVTTIALDALDGHIARRKNLATPGRGAARHSRRSHDRKCVLHLFRRGGNGFAVATGFLFCARSGDGFSARAGHARGALRVGRERDASDVVGTSAGRIALEPRFVCGNEVSLLLLPGTGIGVDARAGSTAGRNDCGFARFGPCWRACADVDDGSVLFVAWVASVGGGMAFRFECGPGAQSEESCAGGDCDERGGRETKGG